MVDNKPGSLSNNGNILRDPMDLEGVGLRQPNEYENS